jgi:hypothetical protein
MIRLTDIIIESEASKEAKRLGLTYMYFGRWGKDGVVTHDTQKGKLVPISTQSPDIAHQRRGVVQQRPGESPREIRPSRPTPDQQREKNLPEPTRNSSRMKNIITRLGKLKNKKPK